MILYKNGYVVATLNTKNKAYDAWPLIDMVDDKTAVSLSDVADSEWFCKYDMQDISPRVIYGMDALRKRKKEKNMAIDRADWHWATAEEAFRKTNDISGDLTQDQINTVWLHAANHIGLFLQWIIDRALYGMLP